MMVRKHITFYGEVQGVGFRWRARQEAKFCGCTGFVRNNWDGSVTMEIQGEESQIDQVIMALEEGRYIQIQNMDSRTIPVNENEREFTVETCCADGNQYRFFSY